VDGGGAGEVRFVDVGAKRPSLLTLRWAKTVSSSDQSGPVNSRGEGSPFRASYSSGVSSNLSPAVVSVNSPGRAVGSVLSTYSTEELISTSSFCVGSRDAFGCQSAHSDTIPFFNTIVRQRPTLITHSRQALSSVCRAQQAQELILRLSTGDGSELVLRGASDQLGNKPSLL